MGVPPQCALNILVVWREREKEIERDCLTMRKRNKGTVSQWGSLSVCPQYFGSLERERKRFKWDCLTMGGPPQCALNILVV